MFDESSAGARELQPAVIQGLRGRFVTGLPWFDSVVPEGVPVPSSIVLSGQSGTGKPFVGLAVAAAWLRQGGRVIFVPMHCTYPALFQKGLRELLGTDMRDYSGSWRFVLFDPEMDLRKPLAQAAGEGAIRANLVNPAGLREALAMASAALDGTGPILVYAVAVNLLLFSHSFGSQTFETLLDTVRHPGSWTYLIAISSSILLKMGLMIEQAADHLFVMQRLPRQRNVYLRAQRVRGAAFFSRAVPVPAQPDYLEDLKNEAVASRRILIPVVSKI